MFWRENKPKYVSMNLCTLDSGIKFCLMIYSIAYHPIWLRMLSSGGEKSSRLVFIVLTCGAVQLSFRKRIQKATRKVGYIYSLTPIYVLLCIPLAILSGLN